MALEITARARLREFLANRFNLNELKNLAFDLGVDYELLAHETKQDLSRELIAHVEHRNRLSCLITEVLRRRQDEALARILARLPACSPAKKIQIIAPDDVLVHLGEFLDEIAARIGVHEDQVALIATAQGTVRLLIAVSEHADLGAILEIGRADYGSMEVTEFNALAAAHQKAWRWVAQNRQPSVQGKIVRPTVAWEDALDAVGRLDTGNGSHRGGPPRTALWGAGGAGLILLGLVIWQLLMPLKVDLAPISIPTATQITTTMATRTATPVPTPTLTVTPTATPTVTPTMTLTEMPTETPTAPPSQHIQLKVPAAGGTYHNPVTFTWSGLSTVAYQVTMNHLERGNIQHKSEWLQGFEWTIDLPGEEFGWWEWYVTDINGVRSAAVNFVFQPIPGMRNSEPPTDTPGLAITAIIIRPRVTTPPPIRRFPTQTPTPTAIIIH